MKKLLFTTVAFVALGATVPALAADLGTRSAPYTKAPAYVQPIYNWTGFYIGGHLGGAFSGGGGFPGATGSNTSSFLGGVQVGADYQFAPNWVIGAEGQYSWLASNNNSATFATTPGLVYNDHQHGLGSVTGRLGYTWGPALLYAKGGYAYSDYSQSLTAAGVPQPFALNGGHHDGYTVGGGLEYMFAPNWSAKAEYQYYNFGSTTFTGGPAEIVGSRFRNDEHTVKLGVNYRFGWGGPVAARY